MNTLSNDKCVATQVRSTMSDNVVFHTADPVTGTTMLMGDNGTYTYKEESEPLGQRIELTDPSPGFPTEYADVLGNARDPEWQCDLPDEFYGGFFDQPVHCQRKDAQLASFSIYSALRSMEPENPHRVSQAPVHTHPPQIQHASIRSPGEYAILKALSATNKTDDESEGGCDWDHDGTDDCALTVSGGPDFAEIDASSSVFNDKSFRLRVMDKAEAIIRRNDKCAKFLSYLEDTTVSDAPYVTANPSLIMDLQGNAIDISISSEYRKINALSSMGLMRRAENRGRISSSGNSGLSGNGIITWATTHGFDSVSFNNEFYSLSDSDAAVKMLHEALHQNAGFSDQALARAASMYGRAPSYEGRTFEYTDEGTSEASLYLQEAIERNCGTRTTSIGSETVIR